LFRSFRISGHLPAHIKNGGRDRFWNWRISNLKGLVTLTLDRIIRHTVVHHSSTSTYMYTKFHRNQKKLFVDRRTYGRTHIWPILLGWLFGVDLKTTVNNDNNNNNYICELGMLKSFILKIDYRLLKIDFSWLSWCYSDGAACTDAALPLAAYAQSRRRWKLCIYSALLGSC